MKALVYDIKPLGWVTCLWLRHLWRGCLTSGLNGLRLRELPPPPLPTPEWVRCRPLLCGICGTDLAILDQRQPPDSILQCFTTLPAVFGHENVAVVEEVGPAADRAWLGKRVCVEPTLCCRVRGIDPPCPPCRAGQYGACENFSADGLGTSKLPPGTSIGYCGAVGGAWSESFVAHACQLVEVPAALTDRQAVLTDPLACGLHGVLRADLRAVGSAGRVLVYGAGILGLGVVWALRATGYAGQIDVIARYPHQAKLAEGLGATETLSLPAGQTERFETIAQRVGGRVTRARFGNCMLSGGYDVVFECVGANQTIQEAMKWCRARGQVVMVSTGHGRSADLTPIWFSELTVTGVYGRSDEQYAGQTINTYPLTHELMVKNPAGLDELLTHTFPLDQYCAAFATAMAKGASGAVKVAFEFRRK